MTLNELIEGLRAADPTTVVERGFHNPHSYRGFYEDLGFEPTGRTTVGEMLAAALDAHGTTYVGWKGGEYTMHGGSLCWLALEGSAGGEEITAELLAELLADVAPPAAETLAAPTGIRAFTRDQLADLGVPFELDAPDAGLALAEPDRGLATALSRRVLGTERWTTVHELVFRSPDDGLTYRLTYDVGSTESVNGVDPFHREGAVVFAEHVEERAVVTREWRSAVERPARGREVSRALTEVRTVLSRAESALLGDRPTERLYESDGRGLLMDAAGEWVAAYDPEHEEINAALQDVIALLGPWQRTGRPLGTERGRQAALKGVPCACGRLWAGRVGFGHTEHGTRCAECK